MIVVCRPDKDRFTVFLKRSRGRWGIAAKTGFSLSDGKKADRSFVETRFILCLKPRDSVSY
jgi:hypothetical protein